MSVLTLATSKGGTGKTTIAMVLAARLAPEVRVTVLDADPTEAFARWARTAYEGPPFETIAETDETRLAHLIAAKADAAELVLVDTAGFGNRAATVAMTSADAVLVPSLSAEADVTEAEKTVRLVEGLARAARRDIPARVVLNRVRRTTLAKHAAREIDGARLRCLTTNLSDLVAFGELSYAGRLPPAGPARTEIEALIAELREAEFIPTSSHQHVTA
jgi:chromosome partitioning protein